MICTPGRRRRAFTLLELLVVIAIIGILAAILFPVFAQVRAQARRATCLAHLSQLGKAHLLYVADYDERYPNWYLGHRPPRPEPFGNLIFWNELLQPYVRSEAIFRCPDFRWHVPEPPGELKLTDYVMFTGGPFGKGLWNDVYWRWAGPSMIVAEMCRPGETICLMDGFTTTQRAVFDISRHRKGANAVMHDGHTKWFTENTFYRVAVDDRNYHYRFWASADR